MAWNLIQILQQALAGSAAPPVAPGIDPVAQQQRDNEEFDVRRRLLAGGRSSTNPTGGLGDTSSPNLAAKSLLGY